MSKIGFVTRFSLSNRTAIGVQTSYIIEIFPEWVHFYWSMPKLFGHHRRSIRLESRILARASHLGRVGNLIAKSYWDSDSLRKDRSPSFLRASSSVSAWYLAPIESQDSARMRSLVEASHKPFVLHLWDHLDGELKHDEHLVWLMDHAHSIAVNSLPLKDDVESLGHKAVLAMFTRRRSLALAELGSVDAKRKIALLGNIASYMDGVDILLSAVDSLNGAGANIEVIYVGSEKQLRRIRADLNTRVKATGWLRTDQDRDRELASCTAGYLPGPLRSGEKEFIGRYSIPSRCLDFLAVNLPIIGTVHPGNATARFLKSFGVGESCFNNTADGVRQHLIALLDPDTWNSKRKLSADAFENFMHENSAGNLKELLSSASADSKTRVLS